MSNRDSVLQLFRRGYRGIEISVNTISLLCGLSFDEADEVVAGLRREGVLVIGTRGGMTPVDGFAFETTEEARARKLVAKEERKARRVADKARSNAARATRIEAQRAAGPSHCACGTELKWGGTMCRPCYRKKAAEKMVEKIAARVEPMVRRRCGCGKRLIGNRTVCATCTVSSTCACGKTVKTAGRTMCAGCAQRARKVREAGGPEAYAAKIAARPPTVEKVERVAAVPPRCACGVEISYGAKKCRACWRNVPTSPRLPKEPEPPRPVAPTIDLSVKATAPIPRPTDPWSIIRERTYGKPKPVLAANDGESLRPLTKFEMMTGRRERRA